MNKLIISEYIHDKIDLNNGNGARIYSFAQDNMAQIFTRGIDKQYRKDMLINQDMIANKHLSILHSWLNETVSDESRKDLDEKLDEFNTNYKKELISFLND